MDKLQGYRINNQFFDTPLDLNGIKLIQAGRYFCNADALIKTHLHKNFVEITIVNEGAGTIICNNEQIQVSKNDIFVSFPFDYHGIIPDKNNPLQYDHLAFIVEAEEYLETLQEIAVEFHDAKSRVIQDSRINYLTYCILGEFNKERPLKNELVRNTLFNILIYLARNFKKKSLPNTLAHATEKEIICNRVMNYIDTNIYSIERLQDISAVVGYNYNYLSTVFSQTIGLTLREYFVNKKLEVANALLAEGKLKVCEIAEKLHYSSSQAFTKAYKQKYGFAPTISMNKSTTQ